VFYTREQEGVFRLRGEDLLFSRKGMSQAFVAPSPFMKRKEKEPIASMKGKKSRRGINRPLLSKGKKSRGRKGKGENRSGKISPERRKETVDSIASGKGREGEEDKRNIERRRPILLSFEEGGRYLSGEEENS